MLKKILNQYVATGLTDTGCIRTHNEDNILIDESLGLLLVADGMGGHQAGEIASMEAIKIIQQLLQRQHNYSFSTSWVSAFIHFFYRKEIDVNPKISLLKQALEGANYHIYQLNQERGMVDGAGMGTTVAGCWLLTAKKMLVFHIGDSRVYRFRNQVLEVITKDHSQLQAWYDEGELGDKPNSNVILRALGPFAGVCSDIQLMTIEPRDSFLICSDGLTDMVTDEMIEKTLQGVNKTMLETSVQDLLQLALQQGGRDNVSIILLTTE